MAATQDIQDLRDAVKELRETLSQLREKFTTDVHSALGISRELHQKQALMVSKLEVRIEFIESQVSQLLRILQGDGTHKGVVGRIDLIEQALAGIVETNKEQDEKLQALQNRTHPCGENLIKLQAATSKVEEALRKIASVDQKLEDSGVTGKRLKAVEGEVKSLKDKEAQFRGGWLALVIAAGIASGVIALAIQIWNLFHP